MITNERQYKITRSEAEKFKGAIAHLADSQSERTDVHPRLLRAEREALESQLEDLMIELQEYEALQSSEAPVLEIEEFNRLGEGLIQARIASGLNQKELAEKLELKPQQIQRYEVERYEGATLKRLSEVIDALGVRVSNDIFVPYQADDLPGLEKKVAQVGIDGDFFSSRILSSKDASIRDDYLADKSASFGPLGARAADVLERIYGWTSDNLFGTEPLSTPRLAAAEARFKMPTGRREQETSAYVAYAHYIAMIVIHAMPETDGVQIPDDPEIMHKSICDAYGELNLLSALHYAWDLGVPVLPLNDSGNFHGACWQYQNRNIVVLKQRSQHTSRWLFDLLHELYHASQHKGEAAFEVIEANETSADRRELDEEIMASQFAGEVVLNGKAEELADICVKKAKGRVQHLKGVVPNVAQQANVEVGALANYLAFRLSWQDINWWGAAANLQKDGDDPWMIARDVFFQRFECTISDDIDRGLLQRALEKQ